MEDLDIEERGFPAAKILAVDDNAANLLALAALLEPLENHFVQARSGAEALDLASQTEFAVILLDVMMPVMDGFETLARLREIPTAKYTPVVFLTAIDPDPRAIQRAYKMGVVDYILKPILPEMLRGKVEALVTFHRRGEEVRRRGVALAAKDRSIGMLAHDLRSPMSAIVTSADLLLRRAALDPLTRKTVDRIYRTSVRMAEMIGSLTDYARAGRGAIPVDRRSMDLGDLCRDLVDDSRLAHPARPIDLECAGEVRGEWDRARLHQAVSNLLANAITYSTGTVAVRVQGGSSEVDVAVHNDGPPIAAEFLPIIFQPFERGSGRAGGGLGLGLFIVSEIAKAHLGNISVSSDATTGTTFVLRLPRSPSASA
jgi:signal transduction histidine kinase